MSVRKPDRLEHVRKCDWVPVFREGLSKLTRILRIGRERGDQLRLMSSHTHFNRVVAKQRNLHLLFERSEQRISPGVSGEICNVRQGHGIANTQFAIDTEMHRLAVSERACLLMAVRAG